MLTLTATPTSEGKNARTAKNLVSIVLLVHLVEGRTKSQGTASCMPLNLACRVLQHQNVLILGRKNKIPDK